MDALNVKATNHSAFQQFTNSHQGAPCNLSKRSCRRRSCNVTRVTCHEYGKHFSAPLLGAEMQGSAFLKGLARCSERPNFDCPGHDLPVQCEGAPPHAPCSAPSATDCMQRCASHCRCFAYVYTLEGQCYLKARGAVQGTWWPHAGFTSGRCDTPEPHCDKVDANVRAHERDFRKVAARKDFRSLRWAIGEKLHFGCPTRSTKNATG